MELHNYDEKRKKEKEQNRLKSIFKRFDFSTLSKVSGTLKVVSYLDSEVLLVYGLFAFFCSFRCAPL